MKSFTSCKNISPYVGFIVKRNTLTPDKWASTSLTWSSEVARAPNAVCPCAPDVYDPALNTQEGFCSTGFTFTTCIPSVSSLTGKVTTLTRVDQKPCQSLVFPPASLPCLSLTLFPLESRERERKRQSRTFKSGLVVMRNTDLESGPYFIRGAVLLVCTCTVCDLQGFGKAECWV